MRNIKTAPNEYWCPWDEAYIDPAVAPDHWCLAMDEHRPSR